jgi:hypothetical protein
MLFLAVSMGFVAENLRERHVENERAHEMLSEFKHDVEQNQKLLDSVLRKNKELIHYLDSFIHTVGYDDRPLNVKKFASELNMWMYRFMNRKNIFDQMKSSGALRYIKDFALIEQILAYEQLAELAEFRAMQQETDHYFNQFRPQLRELFPPAFFAEVFHNPKYMQVLNESDPDYERFYLSHAGGREKQLNKAITDPAILNKISTMFYERVIFIKLSTFNYKMVHQKGKALLEALNAHGY